MGFWNSHLAIAQTRVNMQLFINAQQTHTIEVTGQETVANVKSLVASLENCSGDDLAVYCSGKPLENEARLSQCASNLATLNVEVRMLGGKVHGSLARAGKVKGQTPKVEAQEKKKAKTGRCKRRIQYNRRFSTAVVMMGKKKGPNSNS